MHIFPEGKVNAEQKPMRFKWGVGRLVSEARVTPIVLPMWHCGSFFSSPFFLTFFLTLFRSDLFPSFTEFRGFPRRLTGLTQPDLT